jgi:hypothetical protein
VVTARLTWAGVSPRPKAISRAWNAVMPTAGSTTSRTIESGERWAISSISMPPCGEATTMIRSLFRSSTSPR